jgi:hypothetical protein
MDLVEDGAADLVGQGLELLEFAGLHVVEANDVLVLPSRSREKRVRNWGKLE